ncbi:MAG: tryptophan synthase subunit alpha, partial [Sphingobacterium sp.]
MMKIDKNSKELLSIYFTAGYPTLDSTIDIAEALEKAGVDFLEIGFPYSDPVADGPTIQQSSQTALANGMTLKTLFTQLKQLRERVSIPVFLMGYLNPVLQFGVENFCRACNQVGITGTIIPDLPIEEYEELYQETFEKNEL